MKSDLVEQQISLLVKNWDMIHDIIKNYGERTWKLRSWAVTVWWAVIGYTVTSKQPQLLLYLLVFIIIVFLTEVPWRLIEERFLIRANNIEKLLTRFAVGDEEASNEYIISTNIDIPGLQDVKLLLTPKRLTFWGPYAALFILTIYAWLILSGLI